MASFAQAPRGDSKSGEKIFKTKCAQCHTIEKAAGHKQGCPCLLFSFIFIFIIIVMRSKFGLLKYVAGPNLNGLFGRQSGTAPGYSYSAANKSMAVIWGENTLYDYLLNPKKVLLYSLLSNLFFILSYILPGFCPTFVMVECDLILALL